MFGFNRFGTFLRSDVFFSKSDSGVVDFINQKVQSKKVVMFSKDFCPFCHKAIAAFQKFLGKELPESQFEIVELTTRSDCDAIQNELLKMTGARTVRNNVSFLPRYL